MIKRFLVIISFVFALSHVAFAQQDVCESGTEVGNGGPCVMKSSSDEYLGTEVGNGGPKVSTIPESISPSSN
ncbi:MAG: hypothetical protein HYW47_03775 [Deltaproteobacteria bacterium]|nr:hypothetical protein [Deltaproteobacteria bacterium]